MPDGLWWLPSLIVFGAAAVGLTLGILGFRRLGTRRELAGRESTLEIETRARGMLVRADNAVQEADDELGFAVAQFGEVSTRDFRQSIDRARSWLREAFLLQQRLDDAIPDTVGQRRSWSEQIDALCRSVIGELEKHRAAFSRRRSAEIHAPRELPTLLAALDALDRRIENAEGELAALEEEYAPSALADGWERLDRAGRLLADARDAAGSVTAALDRNQAEPVAGLLHHANDHALEAEGLIAKAERVRSMLDAARVERADALDTLRGSIMDARRVRDRQEDPASAARVNEFIDEAGRVVAELGTGRRRDDPVMETGRLRETTARLDTATAHARSAQDRIDNARVALAGTMTIARSQIRVAHEYIGDHRHSVGADARTRLAEAERQLVLAEAADDPVVGLDTARRAIMHATDADALARYDVGYRRAR